MLISNTGNANIISNNYANGKKNFQSSMSNISSGKSSSATGSANIKNDQLIRSESVSAIKSLKTTKNSTSSNQTDNSSAGKINDQVSMTKSSESSEFNLYTAAAKLKGSVNSQSENSAETTNKSENNNKAADELETNTTNSSSVNLAGQIKEVEEVISTISKAREDLNAQKAGSSGSSGRMENTRQALLAYEDNLQNAETKVRDIDMASETTMFSKNQILHSSSNAMLAQANQLDGNVLRLIG